MMLSFRRCAFAIRFVLLVFHQTVRDDTTAVDDGNLVISGEDPEKAATYYEYYMYNITNPEAVVRSNAFPVLQEVGPYKYKEICRKYRQATSTVDEFQYKELCYKVLVTGNENDIITSVNPQYYGAAMLAGGSETNLKLNAIGGILKTVFASVVAALFAGNKCVVTYLFFLLHFPLAIVAWFRCATVAKTTHHCLAYRVPPPGRHSQPTGARACPSPLSRWAALLVCAKCCRRARRRCGSTASPSGIAFGKAPALWRWPTRPPVPAAQPTRPSPTLRFVHTSMRALGSWFLLAEPCCTVLCVLFVFMVSFLLFLSPLP